MKFDYLEIRPCIEIKGEITSFRDEDEFAAEYARLSAAAKRRRMKFKTFWTLYGIAQEATAIGDFTTKNDAHAVMNGILGVMASARDELDAGSRDHADAELLRKRVYKASCILDDFILQCSDGERI